MHLTAHLHCCCCSEKHWLWELQPKVELGKETIKLEGMGAKQEVVPNLEAAVTRDTPIDLVMLHPKVRQQRQAGPRGGFSAAASDACGWVGNPPRQRVSLRRRQSQCMARPQPWAVPPWS
jgi:hypothetical protein